MTGVRTVLRELISVVALVALLLGMYRLAEWLHPWLGGWGYLVAFIVLTPLFCLLVGLLDLPAWLREWRHKHGLCPHCGYDVRVTPDRCPECGESTEYPPPPRPL